MGPAAIAFIAFSVVVAIYLWKRAPSARRADEQRRWWAFTDRADPEPYFGPRDDPYPGDGGNIDGSGGFGGGSGRYG